VSEFKRFLTESWPSAKVVKKELKKVKIQSEECLILRVSVFLSLISFCFKNDS